MNGVFPNAVPRTARPGSRGGLREVSPRRLSGLLFALVILVAGSAAAAEDPRISDTGFTTARVCGECHVDIYESWKQSLHALSLTDPIFDTAFMQAVKEGGDEARRACLSCHAPMTMVNGDYDLAQGVTREGVSCDFCHSVVSVHVDRAGKPFTLDVGATKRSVLRQAESPAHEVAFSELHGTSEFCGGCHNYTTPKGAMVLSTYEEWRRSPYAGEGIHCQDCHMQVGRGNIVRSDLKRSNVEMHQHRLIHDTNQLRSALAVTITKAERSRHGLIVDVVVENVGSGHMVPTGIPSREVVLALDVRGDTFSRTQERRYRKVVAGARGRVLHQDYEVLLSAERILNDTRIAPREKRYERFSFDLPRDGGGRVRVAATLRYKYSPVLLKEQPLEIELGQAATDVD